MLDINPARLGNPVKRHGRRNSDQWHSLIGRLALRRVRPGPRGVELGAEGVIGD